MPEPVLDPAYWNARLASAKEEHHAIFRCPLDRWRRIEAKHRDILARTVGSFDRILDVGCGWGRLLDLLPEEWCPGFTGYLGVDLAPDFIVRARQLHPGRDFRIIDARLLWVVLEPDRRFDLAVMVSFRPMIRRNCGEQVWAEIEESVRKHAAKLLYLEYDELDEGGIE